MSTITYAFHGIQLNRHLLTMSRFSHLDTSYSPSTNNELYDNNQNDRNIQNQETINIDTTITNNNHRDDGSLHSRGNLEPGRNGDNGSVNQQNDGQPTLLDEHILTTNVRSKLPSTNFPSELKDNWQQQLVKQFMSFRTQETDDSLGAPSPPRRHDGYSTLKIRTFPEMANSEGRSATQRRHIDKKRDTRFQGDFGAFSSGNSHYGEILDDRTLLLDVFGEAAKEYLTQRVVCHVSNDSSQKKIC